MICVLLSACGNGGKAGNEDVVFTDGKTDSVSLTAHEREEDCNCCAARHPRVSTAIPMLFVCVVVCFGVYYYCIQNNSFYELLFTKQLEITRSIEKRLLKNEKELTMTKTKLTDTEKQLRSERDQREQSDGKRD